MELAGALAWWGSKPIVVPRGAPETWTLLFASGGIGSSDDVARAPRVCYVTVDRSFRHLAEGNRFDLAVAEGAVYVCATYVGESYAPSSNQFTRPVRVRGRDGLLKQGGEHLRQVDVTIPAGADAVYVLTFVDSPKWRTEAEFLRFVESLEGRGSPRP